MGSFIQSIGYAGRQARTACSLRGSNLLLATGLAAFLFAAGAGTGHGSPPGTIPEHGPKPASASIPIRVDGGNPRGPVAIDHGGFLTAPSAASPEQILLDFVTAHRSEFGLTPKELRTLVVEGVLTTPHNGTHFVTIGQQVDGIRVHNAAIVGTVDSYGRLVLAGGRTGILKTSGKARLTAAQAINQAAELGGAQARSLPPAAQTHDPGRHEFDNPYAQGMFRPTPVSAELVWHMNEDGSLRLAWLTDVEAAHNSWYQTLLDADNGQVLWRESRYAHLNHPRGRVFTGQHPDDSPGGRQIVDFTGWVDIDPDFTTTVGNNVIAYQDRDNSNAIGYQPEVEHDNPVFDFPFSDAWRGLPDNVDFENIDETVWNDALAEDLDATITQLFYYTNDMHQWLYGFGFDEAAGNFQQDNFGLGGVGGDPVLAEAHDGIDFGCQDNQTPPNDVRCANNANFSHTSDGTSPRMQMYLWIRPNRPYRDGSFDGDVIAHEYGHGVSNRLVPNSISTGINQGGSLGEGWSDAISFLRWGDNTIGEYVTGNADRGIRNFAYDVHPWTYGDYSTNVTSPHRNGEIWGAAMYDVRTRLGINTTTQLMLDGMRSTPNGPLATYLDARDGILAADLAAGDDNRCALWAAFSLRGMGVDAVSNGNHAVPTEDFAAPGECMPSADAGGPYGTIEGTDVVLTAGGSAKGSHDSAGMITQIEWDFTGNGEFDDASGILVNFDRVGIDGTYTVAVRVTDQWGLSATTTATVTVENVLPEVFIEPIDPIDEGGTVTITGQVTDPGWLEPLTATIDFDDGAGPQALAGVLDNTRPDATLSFEIQKQYGDTGDFEVQVCGRDTVDGAPNDQVVCATAIAAVANVDPEVAVDDSAAQNYGGNIAFVLKNGEELNVPATATDPGSDDLTFTWDWGDGSVPDTQIDLVNPPNPDPPKSPSVQPRDVTLAQAHTYLEACLYQLTITVTDDDGGSGEDAAAVVVTGNATESKGSGWWKNQFREDQLGDFSEAELQCYLDIATFFSLVFDPPLDGAEAEEILHAPAKSPPLIMLREQLLAAWLNFANGAIEFDTPVNTTGKKKDGNDSTFGEAILTAELVAIDPNSSPGQIRQQKDIVERIVLRDGG